MSGITFEPDTPEARKLLNDLARHRFIKKMYEDILIDMQICKVEGWDPTEYIRMLQDVLNHFNV